MKQEFALAYLTTAPMEALEALLVAYKVGYHAIGVRLAPLSPGGHFSALGEHPALLRQTVARVKDTGVTILDVEGVRLDERSRTGHFNRLLEVSAALGAKAISVIGDDPQEPRLVNSFADLCDAAAPYHLEVALEFMPYSAVPDANSALRIVTQAQRRNARIVVDFLHATRSNTTREDLAAIPREWLGYAQLCDAPAEIPATREALIHTARYERLLPGAGGIDVRGMVADLPAGLPLSVETPNVGQLALYGAEGWARRALSATRQVITVRDL